MAGTADAQLVIPSTDDLVRVTSKKLDPRSPENCRKVFNAMVDACVRRYFKEPQLPGDAELLAKGWAEQVFLLYLVGAGITGSESKAQVEAVVKPLMFNIVLTAGEDGNVHVAWTGPRTTLFYAFNMSQQVDLESMKMKNQCKTAGSLLYEGRKLAKTSFSTAECLDKNSPTFKSVSVLRQLVKDDAKALSDQLKRDKVSGSLASAFREQAGSVSALYAMFTMLNKMSDQNADPAIIVEMVQRKLCEDLHDRLSTMVEYGTHTKDQIRRAVDDRVSLRAYTRSDQAQAEKIDIHRKEAIIAFLNQTATDGTKPSPLLQIPDPGLDADLWTWLVHS